MRVSFYLAEESDLEPLRHLDPDRDWREFQRGQRAWVLQTYLRLVRAGYPAELTDDPPAEGIIVFHSKHRRLLLEGRGKRLSGPILVGIRADNREPSVAEFQILQNGRWADERSRFHVHHWPQPGLVPRDPGRGERVLTMAYKGFEENLHPDFRAPRWRSFLAERGITWLVDAVDYGIGDFDRGVVEWPDFREVDVVFAVRPPDRRLRSRKPATKLINAWLAGTPAILGPEHAYRELRRSELDYLEVQGFADAQRAIERLCTDPALYRAMRENGRRRAVEFSEQAILARWVDLLYVRFPPLSASPGRHLLRRLPMRLRIELRRWRRILSGRPAR